MTSGRGRAIPYRAGAAATVPIQFWAGWPFLHQAAVRARSLQANTDTLIALGTLAAFVGNSLRLYRFGRA